MARLESTLGMMGAAVEALRDAERVALAGVGRTLTEARRASRTQRKAQRAARWRRIINASGINAATASEDEGAPFKRAQVRSND